MRNLLEVTFFWRVRSQSESTFSQQVTEAPSGSDNQDIPLTPDRTYTAAEVIAEERKFIRRAHPEASTGEPNELIGLALSGGGIRSATFNLGVLRSLAKSRLLAKIAYLSTVSGGGYIGSWLTAWASRLGFKKVCDLLATERPLPPESIDPSALRKDPHFFEPDPVHWLRKYTSYLIPKLGLFSGDMWTAIGIYMRNLFLNQALLAAFIFVGLCLLQLLALGYRNTSGASGNWPWQVTLLAGGLFVVIVAATGEAWLQFDDSEEVRDAAKREPTCLSPWFWIAGFCASAVLISFAWKASAISEKHLLLTMPLQLPWPKLRIEVTEWWHFALTGAIVMSLGSVLLHLYLKFRRLWQGAEAQEGVALQAVSSSQVRRVLATPAAGAAAGLMLYGCPRLFAGFKGDAGSDIAVLAIPVILTSFVVASYAYVGLVGVELPDAKREWLGAACGSLLKIAVIWAAIAALALYGPHLTWLLLHVHTAGWKKALEFLKWFLPGGWVAAVVSGLWAAHSPKTGSPDGKRHLELLAKLAPFLFLGGVIIVLSSILVRVTQGSLPEEWQSLPSRLSDARVLLEFWKKFWTLLSSSAVIAVWLLLVLDVNEFSMHLFYRNRLVRAYLGASDKDRRAHPYTKFAREDDIFLGDLGVAEGWVDRNSHILYDGPYHLICTALNLVGDQKLEYQERKAASFIYSPLFCGFDTVPEAKPAHRNRGAYRRTHLRGEGDHAKGIGFSGPLGPSLGTAMAASGAAASPNMGFHSSPMIAALMTFFNVRLGWWVGNPANTRWTRYGPAPWYLFNELSSRTNDHSDYIYLSDGGHFENLGIYELVRRRVPCIIVCDAAQDGEFKFTDLGNAIERCRRDFGAEIDINLEGIKPQKDATVSKRHFAVGQITYARPAGASGDEAWLEDFAQNEQKGWLLYLKSSLTDDEPVDVLAHHTLKSAFPHDPTSNQFFTESIFESYRRLGEAIAEDTLATLLGGRLEPTFSDFVESLKRYYEAAKKKPPLEPAGRVLLKSYAG